MQHAQDSYLKVTIKCETIESDPNVYVDPLNDLDEITDHHETNADIVIEPEKLEKSDNELELDEKQISVAEFDSENDHTKFEENIEIDEDILSNIKPDEDDEDDEDDKITETDSAGRKSTCDNNFVVSLHILFTLYFKVNDRKYQKFSLLQQKDENYCENLIQRVIFAAWN